jgi:O-antigen ligase/polysaccharide polymerase Wzy-like membrane protein
MPDEGATRLGRRLADAVIFLLFLAVPMAASSRFWDQFTTVKWYVLSALAVAWLAVEVFLCGSRGWPGFVRRHRVACVLLLVLLLVSSLRAGFGWAAQPLLERSTFCVLVLCAFWYFSRSAQRTGPLEVGVMTAVTLVDVVGLLQIVRLAGGAAPDLLASLTASDHRSAFLGNVNIAGQFLGFSVLVLLSSGLERERPLARRVAAGALIATSLAYLYFLGCRSCLLALGGATIVFLVSQGRALVTYVLAAAIAVLAATVFLPVAPPGIRGAATTPLPGPGAAAAKWHTFGVRLALWRATLRMIHDRPLGVGSGNFVHAFIPYQQRDELLRDEKLLFASPHNEYLRALAEEGVVSCALLAVLLFRLLGGLRRSHVINGGRSRAGALLGSMIAFAAVESLLQFPFALASGCLMIAVMLGMALSCVETRPPGANSPERRPAPGMWMAGAAAAGAWMAIVLWRTSASEYLFVNERGSVEAQDQACRLNPRNVAACVDAAWLHARRGDGGIARGDLLAVLDRSPHYHPALKLLGEESLALGDREAGCRYLRIYDDLFGGNSSLHGRLEAECDDEGPLRP